MAKLPKGYENEHEFLTEARERFQEGVDSDRLNRDAAMDDLEFLSGNQWDPTVQAARIKAGKPCLTINRLPQFVAQVVGDIRINRPGIKVRPAEDGDEDVAELRQDLIRSIEHASKAQSVYANAGTSQVACGIGQFRVAVEYVSDDVFDRDICVRAIPNPFAVVWDAMTAEQTGRDARFVFVEDEMPRKVFNEKYPDQQPNELGTEVGATLNRNGWASRDTVRVCEYWLMKDTPAVFALLQSGRVVEVVEYPDAPEGYVEVIRTGKKESYKPLEEPVQPNSDGEPTVRKSTRKSACMYIITGHAILEGPFEFPISRVPIFRVPGWELNVGAKIIRFGLIRFAKDPQRLMNFWRSISAELLAQAPRAQWLINERSEGDSDDFRAAATSGAAVLSYSGSVAPQRIDPPAFPNAVIQEANLNAQDMKDVTGLHDASLGAQSNETSGKAIMARDRQGDVATYIYPDNLKAAIGEAGRVINELIPSVYDTARTIRVLGEDETPKQRRINDPEHANSMDITVGKYDVVVDAGPSYSTKRVEAAESMMQFVQAIPSAAGVAGDLIAKAQDWPMAEEIGKRLKKMLPPGMVEPEEGEEPKQPDPAQMAQMQMAQHAAELGLQGQEAQVRKAQADADLAQAAAYKAQFELDAMLAGNAPQIIGTQDDYPTGQPAAPVQAPPAAPEGFGQGMPTPEEPATGVYSED